MPLTTAGLDLICTLIANAFSTTGYLGVGDSTTGFSTSQTDLQAASNRLRKVMDSGYPTVSGNVITMQATFATTEANFAWNEWGCFDSSTSGNMLNRKVESLGTKTSAQSWALQITLTLST